MCDIARALARLLQPERVMKKWLPFFGSIVLALPAGTAFAQDVPIEWSGQAAPPSVAPQPATQPAQAAPVQAAPSQAAPPYYEGAPAEEGVEPAAPPPPAPASLPPPVVAATGQWVYVDGEGWVWVPAGAASYAVSDTPYAYVYTPSFGWGWCVSPWGWGPYSYGAWVHRPYWVGRGWAGWPHYYGGRVVYGGPRRGRGYYGGGYRGVPSAPRGHYGGYAGYPARGYYGGGYRYNAAGTIHPGAFGGYRGPVHYATPQVGGARRGSFDIGGGHVGGARFGGGHFGGHRR
jgi:hypothetical protein